MDYKKKYKEALETARKINCGDGVPTPPDYSVCEIIFPELRANTFNKIRNEIINFIKVTKPDYYNWKDYSSWIDWLESLNVAE